MLDAPVDEINNRFDDFLQAEIADTGKPARSPRTSTSRAAPPTSRFFADTIKNASTESSRCAPGQDRAAMACACRARVIAIICPWNLPLLLMTWKAGPALACGNTVVVNRRKKRRAPPRCWAR